MPITASDIKFYYTGGGTGNTSLGGAISTVEVVNGLNGLFDDVGGYESLAGDIEYRCIAVKNTNINTVFSTVRAYIFANTAADDTIEIAPEKPVSGVVQSIIDESTMPAGLSFRASSERSTGIALTSATGADSCINPGEWAAIWIKRTVPAGARAYDNNGYTIRVDGDTGE